MVRNRSGIGLKGFHLPIKEWTRFVWQPTGRFGFRPKGKSFIFHLLDTFWDIMTLCGTDNLSLCLIFMKTAMGRYGCCSGGGGCCVMMWRQTACNHAFGIVTHFLAKWWKVARQENIGWLLGERELCVTRGMMVFAFNHAHMPTLRKVLIKH